MMEKGVPREIVYKIDGLFDKFRIYGITDPILVVEQISYLLLIQFIDEVYPKFKTESLKEVLPFKYENRYSIFDNILRIELRDRQKLINSILDRLRKQEILTGVLNGADFIIENHRLLEETIHFVEGIPMNSAGVTINKLIGDIYEYLIEKATIMSNNGEFYTPRHLVDLMVKMIEPSKFDTIFDPACGTGGFLVATYENIENRDINRKDIVKENKYAGCDINQRLVRLARFNGLFHGLTEVEIINSDFQSINNSIDKQFDIVISNPPLAGRFDSIQTDSNLNTGNSHLLFIEKILKHIKKYGKCILLVPENFLHGTSLAHIELRSKLLNQYKVHGVVSLPHGVLQPYTGSKPSILFFTKVDSFGPCTDTVWFYEIMGDGYTLDAKRLPNPDNNSIPDLLERWKNRWEDKKRWDKMLEEENTQKRINGESEINSPSNWDVPQVWFADFNKILENNFNLSADAYKPIQVIQRECESPDSILEEVLDIELEVIGRLKTLLKETQMHENTF